MHASTAYNQIPIIDKGLKAGEYIEDEREASRENEPPSSILIEKHLPGMWPCGVCERLRAQRTLDENRATLVELILKK